MMVLLTFSCMLSMVLVLWEVAAILGNGCGIQGQNYVAFLQGSKMPVWFHWKNLIWTIYCVRLNVSQCKRVPANQAPNTTVRDRFPGGGIQASFKILICEPSVKNNVGRDRRPNVVILECSIPQRETGEMGRWEKRETREVVRWERWEGS